MGYFAVLAQAANKDIAEHLRVSRLHVNIWALRGLWFGRRLFYFDVGIELKFDGSGLSPDSKVDAIEVLLPFRVEEGKWPDGSRIVQDLYDQVISDRSGPLIFGSPVAGRGSADGQSVIEFDENDRLTVTRISEANVTKVTGYAPRTDSSLYTVPLRHPLRVNCSVYFRVRWRVFGAAPLWKWTRLESGACVDFRVCDTRQGAGSQRDPEFLERILQINSANVFVMAPERLCPTNVGPTPKHIRTLEPGAWSDYLKGAASWQWMAKGLLVYGWHHRIDEGPITKDNPLRVFLALNRPARRPGWLSVAYAAVGFMIASAIISLGQSVTPQIGSASLLSVMGIIGIGSIMGLASLARWLTPLFVDHALVPRLFLRRIERFFLAK